MPGQGMNHEEDRWKMSMQPGLYSQQNYERFAEEWNETVLREAKKWCCTDEAAHLLTKAVLNDCRHRFATKKPPSEPEYYLRAQVCLVYSMTGQNIERLKSYIQDRPFAEESQVSGKTDDSEVAAETEPLTDLDTDETAEYEKTQLSDESNEGEEACAEEKTDIILQGKPDTFSIRPGQKCGVLRARKTHILLRKLSLKTMTRKNVLSAFRFSIRFCFS